MYDISKHQNLFYNLKCNLLQIIQILFASICKLKMIKKKKLLLKNPKINPFEKRN